MMETKKMYLTPRLRSTEMLQKTDILAGSFIPGGGRGAKKHDGETFPWEESGSESTEVSKEGYSQQNW